MEAGNKITRHSKCCKHFIRTKTTLDGSRLRKIIRFWVTKTLPLALFHQSFSFRQQAKSQIRNLRCYRELRVRTGQARFRRVQNTRRDSPRVHWEWRCFRQSKAAWSGLFCLRLRIQRMMAEKYFFCICQSSQVGSETCILIVTFLWNGEQGLWSIKYDTNNKLIIISFKLIRSCYWFAEWIMFLKPQKNVICKCK